MGRKKVHWRGTFRKIADVGGTKTDDFGVTDKKIENCCKANGTQQSNTNRLARMGGPWRNRRRAFKAGKRHQSKYHAHTKAGRHMRLWNKRLN